MKYNKVNKCLDFESITRHGCRVLSAPWMGLQRLSKCKRLFAYIYEGTLKALSSRQMSSVKRPMDGLEASFKV
ncbi:MULTISPECIES: hypothetical protein [Alteromonadaceae]|uniref:Uncharacterized protein n=1 Tax=Brumicola blandensis TaxID=3075611 RepID=A0AAW8R5J0_9ALTE|nr:MULTISPECIES: hypothetical protein [unclassified Alteromonas]MDT0583969.1 hypothetical protein [Alteromonas sp. W409]MDT0628882.1 hypothetical protein [Alteromonas sp. W364]